MSDMHASERQIMALEALQIFAPLGHALGLGSISSQIEDICFKVNVICDCPLTTSEVHCCLDIGTEPHTNLSTPRHAGDFPSLL